MDDGPSASFAFVFSYPYIHLTPIFHQPLCDILLICQPYPAYSLGLSPVVLNCRLYLLNLCRNTLTNILMPIVFLLPSVTQCYDVLDTFVNDIP